jgi:hypothetical protein
MSGTLPLRTFDRTVRRSARYVFDASSTVALSVVPHGGQRGARRNALTAILDNEIAARARQQALADADAAVALTLARTPDAVRPARAG